MTSWVKRHKLLLSWIIIFFGFVFTMAGLILFTISNPYTSPTRAFNLVYLVYMIGAFILLIGFCPICIIDANLISRKEKKEIESKEYINATENQMKMEHELLKLEQKKLELERKKMELSELQKQSPVGSKYCKFCGKQISQNSKVCPLCGANLY